MMNKSSYLLVFAALIVGIAFNSFFIVDEKEKVVKLIAEMPGVEKTDVKILVDKNVVNITAERGDKKYHCKVPLQHKVDENSAKATYKNGILQLVFKLVVEKQTGKKVEVE